MEARRPVSDYYRRLVSDYYRRPEGVMVACIRVVAEKKLDGFQMLFGIRLKNCR